MGNVASTFRANVIGRIVAIFLAGLLGCAAWWSIKLAVAHSLCRSNNLARVAEGFRLTLGNADCLLRQAALIAAAGGNGQDILRVLRQAVQLNPLDPRGWIELGLQAELQGDPTGAEKAFLEAARVDRTVLPRMTLANFYFRHNRGANFWRWARMTLEVAPADYSARPLFRLCWRMGGDAGEILRRAIPNRPDMLRQLLAYLVDEGHLSAAQEVAELLLPSLTGADTSLMLDICDRLLLDGRVLPALRIWNGLIRARLLPYGKLLPDVGQLVTNGEFRQPLLNRGFDWRVGAREKVAFSLDTEERTLRLSFDGSQPEHCEVLWQYIPISEDTLYWLEYEFQADAIPPRSGLRWLITDASAASRVLAEDDIAETPTWRQRRVRFETEHGMTCVRLSLSYSRAPGTTRIAGGLALRRVNLVPALQ